MSTFCALAHHLAHSTVGRFVVDGDRPALVLSRVPLAMTRRAMNDAILREIADFCRRTGVAESTFGRSAVNDGKLASRLRNGGRITTDTLDRIRAFMAANGNAETARPAPTYVAPPAVAPMLSKPLPGRNDP